MRSQSVCSRVAFSISCYVVLPVISAFASASADGHGDAHGGGHGFTWFDWAAQPGAPVGFGYLLLNFVVLLIALNFLIFRPLRKGNAEKSDRIRAELEKATSARTEAENLLVECRNRMSALDSEVETILRAAREEGENARAEMVARAEADADRIRKTAIELAERDVARIKRQVEADVIARAVSQAEAVIVSNLQAADQERLLAQAASEIRHLSLSSNQRSAS